jgi:hypothetical protein
MDRTPITDMATEVLGLRAQVESLMRRVHALEELVDVLSTPIHRKLWFMLQGYRWRRVGRWYWKTNDLS